MDKKRRKYTKEDINKALQSIREGTSIRKASKEYNVPKTTLIDKIKKKYDENSTSGAQTVLTKSEEDNVIRWIFYLGSVGFPVTRSQLIESVAKLVAQLQGPNTFKNGIPGRHWYEGFLSRHPELKKRVSQNLTQCRSNITEENIRSWFLRVETYISENHLEDILQDPTRIFNCDETAFFLAPKEKQVLVRKGSKKVYTRIQNDEKECLTVLVTVSADGRKQPPLVLMPYKRMPANIILKMPHKWSIGRSDTGWMTGENFYEYITNVFHPWLIEENIRLPIILFLDGHVSHLSLPLTQFCKDNGIVLTALLPNSTHYLQPLDVAVFHPLKTGWKKQVQKWRLENNGKKLSREDFSFQVDICLESIKEDIIKNGFRTCGLYPFGANNFNYTKLIDQVEIRETTVSTTNTLQPLAETSTNDTFLAQFLFEIEKRIEKNTLEQFKVCGEDWNGNISDESLFHFWRKIKNEFSPEPHEEHNLTLEANLPSISDINDSMLNVQIDESFWSGNEVIDLEVQPDGTVEILNQVNKEINRDGNDSVYNEKNSEPEVSTHDSFGIQVTEDKTTNYISPPKTPLTKSRRDSSGIQEKENIMTNYISPPKTPLTKSRRDSSGIQEKENITTNYISPHKTASTENSHVNKGNREPNVPTPLKNIPTPFKKSMFWPETKNKEKVKKITKKLTPTVATSEQFIQYQTKIDMEKKKKDIEKAERALKRKCPKTIKKTSKEKSDSKNESHQSESPKTTKKTSKEKSDSKNESYQSEVTAIEQRYVVVRYEEQFFPGLVIGNDSCGTLVKTMAASGNNWKWPLKEDILSYADNDIVADIRSPTLLNKRGIYSVPEVTEIQQSNIDC